MEFERWSRKSSVIWIIVSTSLFTIIVIESEWRDLKDNYRLDPSVNFRLTSRGGSSVFHHPRAKWSGGGEVVEFGRWSGKSSALWIIVLTTLSNIIVFGSVFEMEREYQRRVKGGAGGFCGVPTQSSASLRAGQGEGRFLCPPKSTAEGEESSPKPSPNSSPKS